jgi:hypothetical protein
VRSRPRGRWPRARPSAAARYGASVVRETTKSAEAYAKIRAKLPRSTFVKYHLGWLDET